MKPIYLLIVHPDTEDQYSIVFEDYDEAAKSAKELSDNGEKVKIQIL
jgi:hypothetical protein